MDFDRINTLLDVIHKTVELPKYTSLTKAAEVELDKMAASINKPKAIPSAEVEPQPELPLGGRRV